MSTFEAIFDFFYGPRQARKYVVVGLGFLFAEITSVLILREDAATQRNVPFVLIAGAVYAVSIAVAMSYLSSRRSISEPAGIQLASLKSQPMLLDGGVNLDLNNINVPARVEGIQLARDAARHMTEARLAHGTVIEGVVSFSGIFRVDGHVDGRIESAGGTLIVGETATINGHVLVSHAVIGGHVNADVSVQSFELLSTGRLEGSLTCSSLRVDDGALLLGRVSMGQPPPANATSLSSDGYESATMA